MIQFIKEFLRSYRILLRQRSPAQRSVVADNAWFLSADGVTPARGSVKNYLES